ncbi:tobamovirus multiplication protein 1-like [Bidens hawaiensis]|uniref:tobamovirus multiplication protein 1-like n=1 Tax=Bidens hawaiensis TaxID=980011 RepID=UPI0040498073
MFDTLLWSEDGIFFTLCCFYALVSAIALIQLIRIEIRLPEYGWTTQKVFHLMHFIVHGVRAIVFGYHMQVLNLHLKVFVWVLLDIHGLLFFSTYAPLLLHWAEIYYQARSWPADKLKITYSRINVGVSVIQVCIWIYLWVDDSNMVHFVGKLYVAVVSFMAALGFLFNGGRLYHTLLRFPVESEGRKRKLHEVGSLTTICFTFFLVRCFVGVSSAFDSEITLYVFDHPVPNLIFYMLTEILPSAMVLFILRQLPRKKVSTHIH